MIICISIERYVVNFFEIRFYLIHYFKPEVIASEDKFTIKVLQTISASSTFPSLENYVHFVKGNHLQLLQQIQCGQEC